MFKYVALIVTFCLALPAFSAGTKSSSKAAKPLTNEDIVTLVEAGIPESVIVEKIKSSATAFDSSTEGLLALKKASVPNTLIRLVVNPKADVSTPAQAANPFSTTPADAPEPCKVAPGIAAPWLSGASPAMWYTDEKAENRVEMQYERGSFQDVGFMGIGARLLLLRPINAPLRVGKSAKFYSCINPSDAPLVKFSVDKEDNERNTTVARGGPWKQSFRLSDDDLVDTSFTKSPQGFFEITSKSPLETGEYGFVPAGATGVFNAGERVYTFGVD